MSRIATITDNDLMVNLIDNSNIAARSPSGFGSTGFDPAAYDMKVPNEDALLFVENWELVVHGTDQDDLATKTRVLIRLLRRAFLYRTDQGYRESHQPVYITMQVTGETNPRYALVWGCRALEHGDYFGPGVTHSSIIQEFGINIARYIWRSGAPGVLPPILVLGPTDGPDYTPDEVDYQIDLLAHDGSIPSTATGGILGRPGVFGRGVQVAEAMTNLILNPSFETNNGGWLTAGGNTIAISSDQAKYGTRSLKCTYQAHGWMAYYDITLTAVAHTVSMNLYIPSSYDGTGIRLQFEGFVGGVGTPSVEANMALTDQWQSLVVSNYTPDAGDLDGRINIYYSSAPTVGRFVYIDAVQIEAKAYPTPYCDGSLGLGHAWAGAVHASTSTRVATDLQYVVTAGTAFTISCYFIPVMGESEADTWSKVFMWYGDADNHVYIQYNHTTNELRYTLRVAGVSASIDLGGVSRHVPVSFTCTWDGAIATVYKNGGSEGSIAQTNTWTSAPDMLYLGKNDTAAYWGNGTLDDVFILDRVMSTAEASAHYNSGKPFVGDPDLLLYLNFDGPKRAHVSNFRDDVELTHIKVMDESGGPSYVDVFGTDEWVMFPDPIGTNDGLWFGSTDHFPKMIVIPKLSVKGLLTDSTFKLYYWSGAGWTELVLGTDYTCFPGPTLEHCFEQRVHDIVISINPPNNADQVAVDGDTCDWVWIKETHAAPVYAVHPVASQGTYTQRTPTIKIPSTTLYGDISPYLLARIFNPAGGDENENFASVSRIIVGSKEDPGVFVSRLNLGGDDNPTGWSESDDTDTTFTPQPVSPGGMNAVCTFAGDETMVKRVTLTGAGKLGAWVGEYRVSVLAEQKSGAAGDTAIMLRTYIHETNVYSPKYDTKTVVSQATDKKREMFDLGKIKIPFTRVANADDLTNADLIFEIHAERTTGAGTLEFSEFVLIPVDKWSCELDDPITDSVNGSSALRGNNMLQIDGGVLSLRTGKFIVYDWSYLYPADEWGRGGPPLKVEPETATTLYFLIMHYPAGGTWGEGPFIASPACHFMFELYGHACYEILRGND